MQGENVKVAVVGAGFAGLAVSWFLLEKGIQVDLYDEKGVGAGASGMASGLLHPYVGEGGKRSFKATEALSIALELLAIAQKYSIEQVADFSGLLRQAQGAVAEVFLSHAEKYGDVEQKSEDFFLIKSGVMVRSPLYLEGLYQACVNKGLQVFKKKIMALQDLQGYDLSVFAVGAGIFSFPELASLPLKPVKGQALKCDWPSFLPFPQKSLLGKGHIIPLQDGQVYLGSTYERGELDDSPYLDKALKELAPKAKMLVPGWEEITVNSCHAAVRVACVGRYIPLLARVQKNVWVFTALASRGLLYHGYAAKAFVESLAREDCSFQEQSFFL